MSCAWLNSRLAKFGVLDDPISIFDVKGQRSRLCTAWKCPGACMCSLRHRALSRFTRWRDRVLRKITTNSIRLWYCLLTYLLNIDVDGGYGGLLTTCLLICTNDNNKRKIQCAQLTIKLTKVRCVLCSILSVLKTKDLKADKLLKWCSSAGRQFHGLTTLSAKKLLRTSTRQWSLYAWSLVLRLLLANVKVLSSCR